MKTLFALTALVLLSGCEFRIETKNAQEIKNEMVYFEDKYGNCFASIGSMGSHGFVTTSIATIPCERMP